MASNSKKTVTKEAVVVEVGQVAASEAFELLDLTGGIDYQVALVDANGKTVTDDKGATVLQDTQEHIEKGDVLTMLDSMAGFEVNRDTAQQEIDSENVTLSQVLVGIAQKCASEIEASDKMEHGKEGIIPTRAVMFDELVKGLAEQAKKEGKHVPTALRQRKSDIKRALVHGIEPANKTCFELKKAGLLSKNTTDDGKANNLKSALELALKVLTAYNKAEKAGELTEGRAGSFESMATEQVNATVKAWNEGLAKDMEQFKAADVIAQVEGDEEKVIAALEAENAAATA